MTDRYENIRRALAMGPTPGPWYGIQHEGSRWTDIYQGGNRRCATPIAYVPPCNVFDEDGITWKESKGETIANAKHVAACDPDTIRALLAERDDLLENGKQAIRWAPSSAHWSNELKRLFGDDARLGIDALESKLRNVQAERDALRADVAEWKRVAVAQAELHGEAEARAERLVEALEELITWIPSADTYRRLGFDPEAPMRALGEARAALAQEARHDHA